VTVAVERQYIFFRTGRALLVFTVGVLAIIACAEVLPFLAPEEGGLLVLAASILTILVIVISFRVDARLWRKPRN
jgi:uncharacterized membrane protein